METIKSICKKIKSFDETEIFYRKDLVKNPLALVIIVHGFAEHLGRYEYLKDALNSYGYSVYRFDNRGHGKSGGKRGRLKDFNNLIYDTDVIVNLAKKENENIPIFMLGHSMGGFIATSYGIKYKNKIDGQILSGAATMMPPQFKGIKGLLLRGLSKIIPNVNIKNDLSNDICTDKNVIEEYVKDTLNLKKASIKFYTEFLYNGIKWLNENVSTYDYPCLILHGREDKIVSYEASKKLFKNINSTDKELKIFEKLYHEILNEKEKDEIINIIQIWINKRLNNIHTYSNN